MIEEKDYDVTLTFELRTQVGFAPIERDRPINHQDAIDNAIGHMSDEQLNELLDGFGGEFTVKLTATAQEV